MPKVSKREVAHHEAGHAVMARALGVEVEVATLQVLKDEPGVLTCSAAHLAPSDPTAYESDAIVAFAGPVAQQFYQRGFGRSLPWPEGCDDDHQNATNCLAMLFCLQRGESLTPRELHLEGERAAAFQNLWQDTLTKTIGLISERHHVIRRVAEALAGRLLTQANLDALIKSGRRMTDTTELAAILELAVLQLLDWGAVTSCFVPDDTTDADLDAARVIVRRRFRESGRLDLVQRLDTAIIEIMMLQWEA